MTTIQELHQNIKYKSNKYIYFKDGTHISHKDFRKLNDALRKQDNIAIKGKLDGSEVLLVVDKDYLDYYIHNLKPNDDYKRLWDKEIEKNNQLENKLLDITKKLYSDLSKIRDFDTGNGIKFIIQEKDGHYRFRFDPYQIYPNFHLNLSHLFSGDGYHTANGGWMKIVGNKLYLFGKSGDYGVFNADIAIGTASVIFPEMIIEAYPNQQISF